MDIARSSLKLFAANVTKKLIGYLALIVFARELASGQLGTFFLFQAMLGIAAVPVDFGLRAAVEKRISEGVFRGELLTTAVVLKLALLGLTIVGVLAFRGSVNEYLGAELAVLFAVALIVSEFAKLMLAVLNGELRVGETAILQATQRVVWVGLGLALISVGFEVYGLVYALIAGFAVMLLWGARRISTTLGRPSLAHARSLLDFSKYSFVSLVGGYFYNWTDVAIIGFFLTQSDVAAYEIAWRTSGAVLVFSSAIATTIYPQVSEWHTDDAIDRIEALIPKVLTPSLFFVVPAFFGVLLFSREILSLIFGQQYASAWLVLIVLTADKVFQAVQIVIGRSLQAIDRPGLAARAAVSSTVMNLVLNVVLIAEFGIIGAAVATVTASLLNDALHAFYLSKFLSLRFPFRQVGWCVFASLCMVGVLLWGRSMVATNTVPVLLGMIVAGGVVYMGIVLLFRPIRVMALQNMKRVFLH
jgi:O-antigen/teichoic acid export membrane protein